MSTRSIIPLILVLSVIIPSANLSARDFPDHQNAPSFKRDVRRLALASNLPNISALDDFVGIRISTVAVQADNGDVHLIKDVRCSIYPNPGYNVWVQMQGWNNSSPSFAVATGLQYEYPSANTHLRRGIGLGWSESYGEIQQVREVNVYALLSRSFQHGGFGLSLAMTMEHAVIDDGHGIPDYDETFYAVTPYISLMIGPKHILQFLLPINGDGFAANLGYEYQFGIRI